MMLGDFNARVGSRVDQDDDWWYERGPHGHGVINEAIENYCLSSASMKPLCVTPGFQRKLFTNRLGNIQSLNSGIALIMPS